MAFVIPVGYVMLSALGVLAAGGTAVAVIVKSSKDK